MLPLNSEGSAEQSEAIGASLRTRVRIFKFCNLCPDSYRSRWSGMAFHSFLQRRSAPRKMVHLPSLHSRMTGKYLYRSVRNSSFVSTHTYPFRRLRRHLPRFRGRLKDFHFTFISCHAGMTFLYESFPYFLF